MNKFLDLLRSIFISIEFLSILISINIQIFFPSTFNRISILIQEHLVSNLILLFSVYVALILASNYLLKEILFPSKDSNILVKWPLYPSLKTRCLLLMSYPILGLIISTLLISYKTEIDKERLSFFLFITILPSISGIFSSYIAYINIKEILIRYSNNGD